MYRTTLFLFLNIYVFFGFAQEKEQLPIEMQNSAEKLIASDGKLTIGGYGEVHYNQPLSSGKRELGKLDVHRMVMLFGYKFNNRTQFITEIEFEHVKEVYIEQAFLQHKLNNYISFRGGLLLIPMGLVNEYHEPTAFNGVERPLIDNVISPTTWREIGLGINGNILPVSVRYQLYLVNGFNGYDGSAKFNGKNGFRGGRQKGSESYISSPNITGKIEYFGIKGLNLGVSGYLGNSQSTLYKGIDKNDVTAKSRADSSVVGISMLGIDARYNLKGIQLRGQYYLTGISNTKQYNNFTVSNNQINDLGSTMTGFYAEVGYNVLKFSDRFNSQLIPFIRFEEYDTHKKVEGSLNKNPAYKLSAITTGLTYKITPGAVLKADMQFQKPGNNATYLKIFNAGIGVMF